MSGRQVKLFRKLVAAGSGDYKALKKQARGMNWRLKSKANAITRKVLANDTNTDD